MFRKLLSIFLYSLSAFLGVFNVNAENDNNNYAQLCNALKTKNPEVIKLYENMSEPEKQSTTKMCENLGIYI